MWVFKIFDVRIYITFRCGVEDVVSPNMVQPFNKVNKSVSKVTKGNPEYYLVKKFPFRMHNLIPRSNFIIIPLRR